MKMSIEQIQNRIDKLRESGRPVPLILEATLIKMKNGKGPRLPSCSRKGMIKGNR